MARNRNYAEQVRREEVKKRIAQLLIRGVASHEELASAFGMKRVTVTKYVREIYQQWRDERPDLEEKRIQKERQLNHLLNLALESFHISRTPRVETTYEDRICPECDGDCKLEEMPDVWADCDRCQGSGRVTVEIQTTMGDAGNPQYLNVAKSIIAESAKMDGLYPASASVKKTLINETKGVGGEIEQTIQEWYLEAPAETIIKARSVIEELNEKIESGEAEVIEGDYKKIESDDTDRSDD